MSQHLKTAYCDCKLTRRKERKKKERKKQKMKERERNAHYCELQLSSTGWMDVWKRLKELKVIGSAKRKPMAKKSAYCSQLLACICKCEQLKPATGGFTYVKRENGSSKNVKLWLDAHLLPVVRCSIIINNNKPTPPAIITWPPTMAINGFAVLERRLI